MLLGCWGLPFLVLGVLFITDFTGFTESAFEFSQTISPPQVQPVRETFERLDRFSSLDPCS